MFLVGMMKHHIMSRHTFVMNIVVCGAQRTSIIIVSALKFGVMMNMHAHGNFMNILVIQFNLLTKKKIWFIVYNMMWPNGGMVDATDLKSVIRNGCEGSSPSSAMAI
jgi:hypothetical protein